MDFELSPFQQRLKETARRFAEERLKPRAHEVDDKAEYPWDHVHEAARLGLFGLSIPTRYGGIDAGALGFDA